MAEDYKPDAIEAKEAKPKTDKKTDEGEICRTALERYNRWKEREQENIDAAYEDLSFYAGEQWPDDVVKERKGRPVLTVNRLPQFVHQVTGDMRQKRPSIKVVPVDSRGDKETSETLAGMIRYVENRSYANMAYMSGADSQVVCGTGAWRVVKEYASESTFNQELRIMSVDDAVAIAWDPDAVLPTREDAKWCIVPVDMSREAFEESYPDAQVEDFDTLDTGLSVGWFDKDMVRVAEYWVKKPIKRTLALMPDGGIIDLTDASPDEIEEAKGAVRTEKRDGFRVCRYLITAAHVLEESEWPGLFIPIIPCIGEEVKIGTKIIRKGLVRDAKDPQRRYNYFISAQTEVVALQPKAPFVGTEKNFEKYQKEWHTANSQNHPFLPYQPDVANGGGPPQRVPPPVSSQGIAEGIQLAVEDMKGTIGIYDAGLGQRSNETSGKAIIARQREGDVATFLYVDNWNLAIMYTGKILIDMIPHTYDTERKIRIMGEDGKVDLKDINKPIGVVQIDPETGEPTQVQHTQNDVTIGAYDVVLDSGPSYSTKREEAKEGMREFIQSSPESVSVILDLFAKAQDWPLADEIGKRFEAIAPPAVQKMIAQQKQESGEQPPPKEPDPMAEMQQAAMQLDLQNKQLANAKLKAETDAINSEIGAGQPGDPLMPIKAQGEAQRVNLEAAKGEQEVILASLKVEEQQLKNQKLRLELAGSEMGIVQGAEKHQAAMQDHEVSLVHGVQKHGAEMENHGASMQEHDVSMQHGEESHAAKLDSMKAKQEQPAAR